MITSKYSDTLETILYFTILFQWTEHGTRK